jgi:hypothetical protein
MGEVDGNWEGGGGMTCAGCKWFKDKKGHVPICARYWKDRQEKCIDWRAKQGQRVK